MGVVRIVVDEEIKERADTIFGHSEGTQFCDVFLRRFGMANKEDTYIMVNFHRTWRKNLLQGHDILRNDSHISAAIVLTSIWNTTMVYCVDIRYLSCPTSGDQLEFVNGRRVKSGKDMR